MSEYIVPVKVAIILFPILAFFITLPYMIIQYRKYGSVSFFRTLVIYSFVFYLMVIYFLVVLPLPSLEKVAQMTGPRWQLIPFSFVSDFLRETSFVWNQPQTYLKSLFEPCVYSVLFNVVMFVPLGIYLHYYFKCDLKKTILISLAISLFFELTQLSGLYGLYPRPYRLFDVDDLFINTLGGLLGYLIAFLLMKFLPSREKIDEEARKAGRNVSFWRRSVALFIDALIISIIAVCFSSFIPTFFYLILFSLYVFFTWMNHGQSIGKKCVRIRVVDQFGEKANIVQLFFRYSLLYFFFAPAFFYAFFFFKHTLDYQGPWAFFYALFAVFFLVLGVLFFLQVFLFAFCGKRFLWYEKWSRTKVVSTILLSHDTID